MSNSSQHDILFWIEQEPTTRSVDYFMPSDTPVNNPSALTLNVERRKRNLRHKRSITRLRTYSVGLLEEGFAYVSSQLDRSMLPRKSISKFTSVEGDKFLQEKSADIINLIQHFEDIKAGRTTVEPNTSLTTRAESSCEDTNGTNDEYKKEAEKSFVQITNDITKKYEALSSSLQVSYQNSSYFPEHAQNGS